MDWKISRGAFTAVSLVLAACDADVASREGDGQQGYSPNTEDNGVLLNSFRLNSFRLNSFRLNSFRLNGDQGTDDYIQIVGVDLPGNKDVVGDSWIDGSELRIVTKKGKVLSGKELVGTTLRFEIQEDGEQLAREIRIAGVDPAKQKHHHHHHKHKKHKKWHDDDEDGRVLYDLQIRELPSKKWEPLCGLDDEGEAIAAVLLTDIWDPDTGAKISPAPSDAVTLACVDAALGKCVLWGYEPWASVDGEPLADHHQACTRLARADYCGVGVSYTDEGTPIHVLDEIGIEDVDPIAQYLVEAEWGPDGAVCLNYANTRIADVEVACQDLPACGPSFASGGLIESGKIVGEID